MRALLATRLSVMTDETTSPERQLTATSREAERRGWSVVGVASDLDVSATKTTPFDRPSLGKWLNERADEFDAVIWPKQDRAVRSMADMAELTKWAKQTKKVLVFAEGPGGGPVEFDLASSIVSELILMIFAFAAQIEAQSISERTSDARRFMRAKGRYPGGSVPFGYVAQETSDGWRLFHDPEYAPIIQEIVRLVIIGHSVRSLVKRLNHQGVPTPLDLQQMRNGKWHPPMAFRFWSAFGLTSILRSRNLLGQQTFKGGDGQGPEEVVRDEQGMPVLKGVPLISLETWVELQAALDSRTSKRSGSRSNGALLIRVLFCGVCRQPMYISNTGRGGHYYECSSKSSIGCGNRAVQRDQVEQEIVGTVLSHIGDLPRMIEVKLPGQDFRKDLQELLHNYEAVSAQLASARSTSAREMAQRNLDVLDNKIAELEAIPVLPPRSNWIPSGETWREYWDGLDTTERNAFLRSAGVFVEHVKVMPGGQAWVHAEDPEIRPVLVYEPPETKFPARSRQGEHFFHLHLGIFEKLAAAATGVPVELMHHMAVAARAALKEPEE